MKRLCAFCLIIAFIIFGISTGYAGDGSYNRVYVSLALSGHLFFGVGLEHGFSGQHALHLTLYPLAIPGKGFPFAFSAGYAYYFGDRGQHWRAKLGGDYAMLVSPPNPQRRKTLPMLMLTPGIQYAFGNGNTLTSQAWMSYFLSKKTNRRFAPIALEFSQGIGALR